MPTSRHSRRHFLFRLAAASGLAAVANAASGGPAAALRVMSFNIRYSRAPDADNVWPLRQEAVFAAIRAFDPDLIGFQEVLEDQFDELRRALPQFALAGVARDDGRRKGEWSCVAYRKARFDAQEDGTFWLSETPEVVGSKSWDAALTRICTWARLQDRVGQRELLFANTHFDHKGVLARRESARLLSLRLTELARGGPAILTGDFNFTEDDPGYATLVRPEEGATTRWIDAYRSVHPERQPDEATSHGFKGGAAGSRIDYIFHSRHFRALAAAVERDQHGGRWPSDHYAVTAVLRPTSG